MPDVWNGRRLRERRRINQKIHYRLYDALTGDVLAAGTADNLNAVTTAVLTTAAAHPHARVVATQFDGPA